MNVVSQSKKEQLAQKMLQSTTKFTGERHEVGMLWSAPEPNLPNNYISDFDQLYSLEQRVQRDPDRKKYFSTVNRLSCRERIRQDIRRVWSDTFGLVKDTLWKEWFLPHHPLRNPNKPRKVRPVCNAASNYKEVFLNDKLLKLLARLDLLHRLTATMFRFGERPIFLTAEIESMFLQLQVPEQDRSYLSFLWRSRTNERVQRY